MKKLFFLTFVLTSIPVFAGNVFVAQYKCGTSSCSTESSKSLALYNCGKIYSDCIIVDVTEVENHSGWYHSAAAAYGTKETNQVELDNYVDH